MTLTCQARRTGFVIVVLCIALFSCNSNDWKQFHGGPTNAGYMNVSNATQLTAKWAAPFHIGNVSYSSPAIASDGTIYLGTSTGALVAIKNDGSAFKWVFHPDASFVNPGIVSSPAIGEDGDIYFTFVVTLSKAGPLNGDLLQTVLMKIGADGTLKNSFQFAQTTGFGVQYTTASPKLLDYKGGEFIFIVSRGSLFVFDKTLNAIAQHRINCSGDLTEPALPGTYDLASLSRNYGEEGGAHYFDQFREPDTYWIDPTAAAITNVNGVDLAEPMVVAPLNGCGLEGYTFTPPPGSALTPKWFAPRTAEELISSPAISDNGEVIVGTSSGWLFSYDVVTGNGKWIYNTKEPMMATPAFFIGINPLFAAGENNLYTINGGTVYAKIPLPAKTQSSPAASKGAMVVSTQAGVLSATSNLTSVTTNASILGGLSSPAIGSDGTIYVVSANGSLMAFTAH